MFPRIEINSFKFFLRRLKRFIDERIFNRLVFGYLKSHHHVLYHIACKNTHEGVLKRHEELCFAWVTLTPCAPAQLVVNASRFMPLRPEHKQTAETLYLFVHILTSRISAEFDVN